MLGNGIATHMGNNRSFIIAPGECEETKKVNFFRSHYAKPARRHFDKKLCSISCRGYCEMYEADISGVVAIACSRRSGGDFRLRFSFGDATATRMRRVGTRGQT